MKMQSTSKVLKLATAMVCVGLGAGCATFTMGPGQAPTNMDYMGLGNVYLSTNDLRSYDGDLIRLDVLNNRRQSGEILAVDVWPLVGVGVGLVGARANIGPVGAGLGTLFYHPLPAHRFEGDVVEEDVVVETRTTRRTVR